MRNLALLLLISLVMGCSRGVTVHAPKEREEDLVRFIEDGKPQRGLPTTTVTFHLPSGPVKVRVQVASTMRQRAKGLMFRHDLADDEGMLFVFPDEEKLTFWMKNTFVPLDMIFLDSHRTVVGVVEGAVPLDESPRGVGRPAQYVIEVRAGFVRRHSITKGVTVTWEPPHGRGTDRQD